MTVIDTHVHFWQLTTYPNTGWMNNSPVLLRDYLPEDLAPELTAAGVDQAVIVEAGREPALNRWWLTLAERTPWIAAVVAGGTLEDEAFPARLDEYSAGRALRGMRVTPPGPPAQWAEQAVSERNLAELARRDLSLDLLVGYPAFAAVGALAQRHPALRINLNHCGHPPLREGEMDAWRAALAPLAACPNLWVKYSSLLLYSYPDSDDERLRPTADFLLESFGVDRLFWGSNWPVELLGGSYAAAYAAMRGLVGGLSAHETAALFGGSAATFYRISAPSDAARP